MRIEVNGDEGVVRGLFDKDGVDIYEVTEAFVNLLILEGYAPISIHRGLGTAMYNLKERFKGIPFDEED